MYMVLEMNFLTNILIKCYQRMNCHKKDRTNCSNFRYYRSQFVRDNIHNSFSMFSSLILLSFFVHHPGDEFSLKHPYSRPRRINVTPLSFHEKSKKKMYKFTILSTVICCKCNFQFSSHIFIFCFALFVCSSSWNEIFF